MSDSRSPAGRKRGARCGAALLLLLVPTGPAAAQVSDFDVAAFRTQRGTDITVVDGVLRFDPRIVEGGEDCAYVVGIEIKDSDQLTIRTDEWRGLLSCEPQPEGEAAARRVWVVESFQFAVVPGTYSLDISLQPAGKPEAARRASLQLMSLPEGELVSDLILGSDVGWVDTAQAQDWTVRKGSVGIVAVPYLAADAERPNLAYYLEVYRPLDHDLQGVAEGVIRGAEGQEIVRSRLAELEASEEEGGRPIVGSLSLAGLPPGQYTLEVLVDLADTTVIRSRGFMMAAAFEQATVRREAADTLRGFFWSLSDEELTQLFDPVEVWLSSSREQNTYRSLSPDGKRQFLVRFFEEIGPQFAGRASRPSTSSYNGYAT